MLLCRIVIDVDCDRISADDDAKDGDDDGDDIDDNVVLKEAGFNNTHRLVEELVRVSIVYI